MRILLAPDKFKGSLTALQACDAMREGLLAGWHGPTGTEPTPEFTSHPIADGGEGTTEAVVAALGGEWVELPVTDPLGRGITARYGWIDQLPPSVLTPAGLAGSSPTPLRAPLAVMEMSAASGFDKVMDLPPDPWRASTFGTGQMLRHAADRGAAAILLGIGGSATNDGGSGMAAALGHRLLDAAGNALPADRIPADLAAVTAIDSSQAVRLPPLLVAVDVTNPLLGPEGATRVYGPQKGIEPQDHDRHEARLRHWARVVTALRSDRADGANRSGQPARSSATDPLTAPGSGAAGGLGFGLRTLLGARLMPGFQLVAAVTSLEAAVREADLVITGEGRFDRQSLNGKGPAGVAALARQHGVPVAAICGLLEADAAAEAGFAHAWAAKPEAMPTRQAIAQAGSLLAACARENAGLLRQTIGAT